MGLPERIGRYRVLGLLGKGAMGTVYRARDDALDREVAVKVVSAEHADEDARARFAREARAAARLQHPNIVTIYELGEQDSLPYMALERLEGIDLQRGIEAGIRPDPRLTLPVLLQVLAGLGHAHEAGIVHRDVKPSNIFLPYGRPAKVMDFGVARLLGGTVTTGLMVGTPNYMSPEQVRSAADLDGRSDLFSVGLILYELVTGEKAYQATTFIALLYKIANEDPDLGLIPSGPSWRRLRGVLERSLAKKPADRYPDARAMADELAMALRELGGVADPHAPADQILRFRPALPPAPEVAPPAPRPEAPVPRPPPSPAAAEPDLVEVLLPPEPGPRLAGPWVKLGLGGLALALVGAGLAFVLRPRPHPAATSPTSEPAQAPSRTGPRLMPSASLPAPPPSASSPVPSPVFPSPTAAPLSASPSPSASLPEPASVAPSPSPPSPLAPRPQGEDDEARLERADSLFERGQYAAAAAEAQAVLRRNPDNAQAREILEDAQAEIVVEGALRAAREALRKGDRERAIVELERGLAVKPTDGRLTRLRRELRP
jgi:serine/threonine-protein kinase